MGECKGCHGTGKCSKCNGKVAGKGCSHGLFALSAAARVTARFARAKAELKDCSGADVGALHDHHQRIAK